LIKIDAYFAEISIKQPAILFGLASLPKVAFLKFGAEKVFFLLLNNKK
jgi:hypothetical protein